MYISDEQEKRWQSYFFEHHSREQMKSWTKRINLFRYFRAHGGHANDGDSLDLAIIFKNEEELISIFELLKIEFVKLNILPEQPIKGKSYSSNDFDKFPSLIENTKWVIQPGHTQIFGVKVFIYCYSNIIKISITARPYEVLQEDIESAHILEKHISKFDLRIKDPPFDTRNYLCPKFHKELFEN